MSRLQIAAGGSRGSTMSRTRTRSSPDSFEQQDTTYVYTGLVLRAMHHCSWSQPASVTTQARYSRDRPVWKC